MTVEIFEASEDTQRILDAVLRSGAAGIHGGRVAVRKKLGELAELAAVTDHESVVAHSTMDHPDTELAYPYDATHFDHLEASEAVRRAYDAKNL